MAKQLSFFQEMFPCASMVCKSGGEVTHRVTTTYYPHGKKSSPAWTDVSLYCADCARHIEKRSQDPIVAKHNEIKIEKL